MPAIPGSITGMSLDEYRRGTSFPSCLSTAYTRLHLLSIEKSNIKRMIRTPHGGIKERNKQARSVQLHHVHTNPCVLTSCANRPRIITSHGLNALRKQKKYGTRRSPSPL